MNAKRLSDSLQGLTQPVNIRMKARTLAPDFHLGPFSSSGCLGLFGFISYAKYEPLQPFQELDF